MVRSNQGGSQPNGTCSSLGTTMYGTSASSNGHTHTEASHDIQHLKQLEVYRKEWASPDTAHGKALRYVSDTFWYLQYMLGYDVWDHSEHVFVFILVTVLGTLGLYSVYRQALALGALLQPLALKAINSVIGRY